MSTPDARPANMIEDLADLRSLHGLTTNSEVRAFLEKEMRKLAVAGPSSPDDASAVERAGWTLPAQPSPSPSTSAPAAAPAPAAKKGAASGAGKEAAAAADSEGGDSEDGAASDPDEVLVQQERLEERPHGQSAVWVAPRSAPAPPQGAPGGSGQLGTPGARLSHPATASGARASRLQSRRFY